MARQNDMNIRWYYMHGNQQSGPFSSEQLKQEVSAGKLNPKSLVWANGMNDWVAADSIGELNILWSAELEDKSSSSHMPKSVIDLLSILFKLFLKQLPRQILFKLLLFAGIWFIHTYLIVVTNGGFGKIKSQFLGSILALEGKMLTGTLFWMLASGVVFTIYGSVKQDGIERFVNSIVTMPQYIKDAFNRNKSNIISWILGGLTFGIFLSAILVSRVSYWNTTYVVSNRIIHLLIFLTLLLSLSRRDGSLLKLFVRLSFSDIRKITNAKSNGQDLEKNAIIFMTGIMAGVLLIFMSPFLPYSAYFFLLLCIVLTILASQGVLKISTQSLIIFIAGLFVLIPFAEVFGHDGGWHEYGGTFQGWVRGQGSTRILFHGIPPALGGVLGASLASFFSSMGSSFTDFTPLQPPPQPPATRTPEEIYNDPRLHDRFMGEDGQEYVYWRGEGDLSPNPSWGKAEDFEKEQWHKSQGHVLQNGVWMERSVAVQHETWNQEQRVRAEAENRARQEQYDQERKDKAALEAEQKRIEQIEQQRQEYIDRLQKKYGTSSEDELREKIRETMDENQLEANHHNWVAFGYGVAEVGARLVEIGCDKTLDIAVRAAQTDPTGILGGKARAVRAVYKVIKGAGAEAAEHGISVSSITGGAIKGGADAATDYIPDTVQGSAYLKSAVKIAGETVGTAIIKGEGGAGEGFINGVVNEVAKKATGTATEYLLGVPDFKEVDLLTYAKDVEINGHSMLDVLIFEVGVENEKGLVDFINRTGDRAAKIFLEDFREHNIDMFCGKIAKASISDATYIFVDKAVTKPVSENLNSMFRTFFGYEQ